MNIVIHFYNHFSLNYVVMGLSSLNFRMEHNTFSKWTGGTDDFSEMRPHNSGSRAIGVKSYGLSTSSCEELRNFSGGLKEFSLKAFLLEQRDGF